MYGHHLMLLWTHLLFGSLVVVAGQCQTRLVQVQQGGQVPAWQAPSLPLYQLVYLQTAAAATAGAARCRVAVCE